MRLTKRIWPLCWSGADRECQSTCSLPAFAKDSSGPFAAGDPGGDGCLFGSRTSSVPHRNPAWFDQAPHSRSCLFGGYRVGNGGCVRTCAVANGLPTKGAGRTTYASCSGNRRPNSFWATSRLCRSRSACLGQRRRNDCRRRRAGVRFRTDVGVSMIVEQIRLENAE